MQSNEDSLTRLIGGIDNAVATGVCGYYRRLGVERCIECPAEEAESCGDAMLEDIARRLHALMPHDAKGTEIKPGDTIESPTDREQERITDILLVPAIVKSGGADVTTFALSHLWRVVQPDSWEQLEKDATADACEYRNKRSVAKCDEICCDDCITYKCVDLVRRAKRLAGGGVDEQAD